MKKLDFPVIKNKFEHELIKRSGNWVLIEQHNLMYPEAPIKYELWRIKISKPANVWGKDLPEMELMPTAKQWGENGWTYCKLEDAEQDYNEIVSNLPTRTPNLSTISEKRYVHRGKRKTRLFVSADS